MAAKSYIVDAGGVTRKFKKVFAIDAGGVARMAKKIYVIDSGGVARLVYLSAEPFTGLGGVANVGQVGYSSRFLAGQINGNPAGVPMVLNTGQSLTDIMNVAAGSQGFLVVDGFTSDPGINWLINLTVDGTVKTPQDAGVVYTFASATPHAAQWQWPTKFPTLAPGQPFTGSIQHN